MGEGRALGVENEWADYRGPCTQAPGTAHPHSHSSAAGSSFWVLDSRHWTLSSGWFLEVCIQELLDI